MSGATSGQDEEMAIYARQKVGWAHQSETDTTPDSVKQHINEIYAKTGLGERKL